MKAITIYDITVSVETDKSEEVKDINKAIEKLMRSMGFFLEKDSKTFKKIPDVDEWSLQEDEMLAEIMPRLQSLFVEALFTVSVYKDLVLTVGVVYICTILTILT